MRRFPKTYKRPGQSSARALADVALFLAGARTLDNVTPEWLADRYRLKREVAGELLERARKVRADA